MRKSTRNLLLSGILGAFLGGIIIILVLSLIGAGNEKKRIGKETNEVSVSLAPQLENSSENRVNPEPSPAPATASASARPLFKNGKFSYSVPNGYRVAEKIMELDEKNAPAGFAVLTFTRGTEQQEQEYVELIKQIQQNQAATEAPQFLPGQTITVSVTTKNFQDADAKLSHGEEKITTSNKISGKRFVKVEGLFPYDSVYLTAPDGRIVSVQMGYGSEEPLFDEAAFMTVVNSIEF